MARNSLEKKQLDLIDEKPRPSVDNILDNILEEIPEMDSVDRSGILWNLLPLLAALLVVILVPLLLSVTAFRNTYSPLSRDFPFDSVESELFSSAVTEINANREELRRKDITIRRFQQQLENLDDTLMMMFNLVDDSRKSRELALQAETEAILADERIRLLALERSDEEIEQALARLKNNLEADVEDKMDQYQVTELGIYQVRIDSMKTERNNLEKALNAAVEERKALARTLEESEDDLLEVFDRTEYGPRNGDPVIEADLQRLEEDHLAENYWLDELSNQYLGMMNAIGIRDSDSAREHLDALENLFSDERIAELPGIAARNEADREIIRFMRAYIEAQEESGLEGLVAETRLLINQAEANASKGRLYEASTGWQQVGSLWPLMESAITGSRATRDTIAARDIRRYANLANLSLQSGDRDSAVLVWEAGLEEMPDPMGEELLRWWRIWTDTEARYASEQNDALQATTLAYENLLMEERYRSRELDDRLGALEEENRNLERELKDAVAAAAESAAGTESDPIPATEPEIRFVENQETVQQLESANSRISDLEAEIRKLQDELERQKSLTEAETNPGERQSSAQWRLYGVIVQIIGETLIVEPGTGGQPSAGDDLRVMRSLGGDRVIHLADGIILEANSTRAVGTISAGTSGAEVYGAPQVNDLVYIAD